MAFSLQFSSTLLSSKESASVGHLGFRRWPEGSIISSSNVRFRRCFKVRAAQVCASAEAISGFGHMETRSLYGMSGLSQGATVTDINRVHRKLAMELNLDHADSPQGKNQNTQTFLRIHNASVTFSDPYDRQLSAQVRGFTSQMWSSGLYERQPTYRSWCGQVGQSWETDECWTGPEAVLFDVDGTLVDSDPLHYLSFRDMLQEVGFQGGIPITEEFYSKNISGKCNDDIGAALFPDWDESQRRKFSDDKEALFRRKAVENLKPVNGLHKLCKWIENSGLRRAAVTNAPRENAELMISIVGLTDFFELLVIGSECERAKPFPDPYLKALEHFNIPSSRAFALEDSPSGLKAAVAAGLSAVGLTTRNPGQELIDAGATFLIKDFEDPDLWIALES